MLAQVAPRSFFSIRPYACLLYKSLIWPDKASRACHCICPKDCIYHQQSSDMRRKLCGCLHWMPLVASFPFLTDGSTFLIGQQVFKCTSALCQGILPDQQDQAGVCHLFNSCLSCTSCMPAYSVQIRDIPHDLLPHVFLSAESSQQLQIDAVPICNLDWFTFVCTR